MLQPRDTCVRGRGVGVVKASHCCTVHSRQTLFSVVDVISAPPFRQLGGADLALAGSSCSASSVFWTTQPRVSSPSPCSSPSRHLGALRPGVGWGRGPGSSLGSAAERLGWPRFWNGQQRVVCSPRPSGEPCWLKRLPPGGGLGVHFQASHSPPGLERQGIQGYYFWFTCRLLSSKATLQPGELGIPREASNLPRLC